MSNDASRSGSASASHCSSAAVRRWPAPQRPRAATCPRTDPPRPRRRPGSPATAPPRPHRSPPRAPGPRPPDRAGRRPPRADPPGTTRSRPRRGTRRAPPGSYQRRCPTSAGRRAGSRRWRSAGGGPGLRRVRSSRLTPYGPPLQRSGRQNVRMSSTSRSGTSIAAKWPPRSYSDQCSIRPAGSMSERIVESAAKTATPVGGPDCSLSRGPRPTPAARRRPATPASPRTPRGRPMPRTR